jgi:hypothetical protein
MHFGKARASVVASAFVPESLFSDAYA